MLDSGKRVVLDGKVEGIGLEPYFLDVVVLEILGSTRIDEELVFSAHLDHPKESANDNASGSGALLDMARALKELVDGGRLPRPERTLRFLWVPEFYGTMAYVDAHPEMTGPALGGKFLANINMDMVGEHLELIHSRMILTRTPASIPSALNDVVENMAQMVDDMDVRTPRGSLSAFNYRVTPYSGGSDHNVFIDRKIPAMMINHDPDYTHHTSEDTPDKVDPVELERSEILGASALWYLANLKPSEAIDLVYLVAANGAGRLGDTGREARRALAAAPSAEIGAAWAEARNRLDHALTWESQALRSVLSFNDDAMVRRAIKRLEPQLKRQHEVLSTALNEEARARGAHGSAPPALAAAPDRRVPVRRTRGPLESGLPASRLPAERAAWYGAPDFPLRGSAQFELVNLIDGRRTVSEIRNALSAEFGPIPASAVARVVEDLVSLDLAGWQGVQRATR